MSAQITRITKTRQGRFALFCDDGFLFSIDGETMLKNDIHEGNELSEPELCSLRQDSDTRKAKDKALGYISLRDHSYRELYDKLRLKFDDDTSRAAADEMLRLDLLNDASFAMHRAKYLANKGKPIREIEQILRGKGIDRSDIAAAVSELSTTDADALVTVIEKRYISRLMRGEKDKVFAALMRRGFAAKDIKNALARYMSGNDNEDGDNYEDSDSFAGMP